MLNIKLTKSEIAHLYFRDNYIGAVKDESIIEILEVFTLDFMIEVNGVRLFVEKISIKDIKDINKIKSSYEIEHGNLKVGK